MADASYLQTSFLGGEWSPLIQGRMDDNRYRSGMNVCRNTIPIEEGSGARRPGTRLIGPTRKGAVGVLRSFDFAQSHPYNLELTPGHLRLQANGSMVTIASTQNVITALNTANPVQVTSLTAHGLNSGDEILCIKDPNSAANASIAALLGRQIEVTVVDATHFTCADAVTGNSIDGTNMVLGTTGITFQKIADFPTLYAAADLQAINKVQDQTNLLLLHAKYPPYSVQSTTPEIGKDFAVFTFGPATFKDGPYLDPPTDGTTITASALSGSVTLTLAGGPTVFSPTDVGRLVRLFSEPLAWSNVTAYNVGDQVKFNNAYYQAVKANTGHQPDVDIVNWGIATGAAAWTWAIITAFTDTTHVTATLQNPILRTTACATWRLGLFSNTTGYPTNGTYHEGRLWLAGVIGNRIDGSKSNDPFNFSPTEADGTVADNDALSAIFNAKDVNQIYWMEPDERGIICGTQAGEWIVQASQSNDTLTPTSIQAHRRTTYGSANVPARRAGLTIVFVQRYQKKVMEYITTDFRGLSAHNIAVTGKHLTQKGVVEIAYQAEKVPIIWARTADGSLLSCTYKRESPYASDPPDFSGWARHDLGNGLLVESLQSGPNFDGSLDAVSLVVNRSGVRYSVLVTDLFDVDWTIGDAFYVDFGETPAMYEVITGPPQVIRFYSLHYLAGQTVTFFIGGIDAGDFTVAADGHVDIPIDGSGNPLLTNAWLQSLNTSTNFHGIGLAIQAQPAAVAANPTIPAALQFDPSTQGGQNVIAAVDMTNNREWELRVFTNTLMGWETKFGNVILPVTSMAGVANVGNGLLYGDDGYLYGVDNAGNNTKLNKVDPNTLTLVGSFGGGAGAQFTSDATHWGFPADFAITLAPDGYPYVCSTTFNPVQTGNQVTLLRVGRDRLDPMIFIGVAAMNEQKGVVCQGLPFGGFGQFFVASCGTAINGNGTDSGLGLYRYLCAGPSGMFQSIGRVLATAINAAWTHVSIIYGMVVDRTDGNVIMIVGEAALPAYNAGNSYSLGQYVSSAGHDYISLQNGNLGNTPASSPTFWQDLGPTSVETRIVKVNAKTAAAMWSVAISGNPSNSGIGSNLNQSYISNAKFVYADGAPFAGNNFHLHQINTLTGVDTTQTFSMGGAGQGISSQIYNSVTGELLAYFTNYVAGGTLVRTGRTPGIFGGWGKFTTAPATFPNIAPPAAAIVWTVPAAIGYTYTSQGQILRPIAPNESGAQNGPALGKTRRTHRYAALMQQAQGVSFGTVFGQTHPANFSAAPDAAPLAANILFSGVHQDTLEDDYTFDSMLCWEITRPYPATVCTLGAFVHTQDR